MTTCAPCKLIATLIIAVAISGCGAFMRQCPLENKRNDGNAAAISKNATDSYETYVLRPLVDPPEMKRIYFDYKRADLRQDQLDALDGIITFLAANPRLHWQIEGHCDERGTEEYNHSLGYKRAMAVLEYCVKKGISRDRLHPLSYGKDRPVALGHTEEDWQRNRRVMFMEYLQVR